MSNKKPTAKTLLLEALNTLLFQKPFQKISVNELCETAQISRSSFYANFEDKYQLFSYCLNTKCNELDRLLSSHSLKEILFLMLDFVQKEHKFFYNAFGSSFDEELREIFYQFFDQQLTKTLKEKEASGIQLPGPIEAISAFYIGGLTNMIFRWIKSNYKIPKEELVLCQYDLLKDIL